MSGRVRISIAFLLLVLAGCSVTDGRLTYLEPLLDEKETSKLIIGSSPKTPLWLETIDGAKLQRRDNYAAYSVKILPGDRLVEASGRNGFWEPRLRFQFLFARGHTYKLEILDQQMKMTDMATGATSLFP